MPGGDFPAGNAAGKVAELAARYRFLEPDWADRLLHAYGTRAWGMLGDAKSLEDSGTDFGHGLTQREVDFLVAQEWAMTAEDILWRRSKLGLRFTTQEAARLSDYLKEKAST